MRRRKEVLMIMKVKRVALIRAIEATAKREAKRFATETRKKAISDVSNRKKYLAALDAYRKFVIAGGKTLSSYDLAEKLDKRINWASEPKKVKDYSCLLDKLNLATDDVLPIDSKSEFFSFIQCRC